MNNLSPYRAMLEKERSVNLEIAVKNCSEILFHQGNLRPTISQICQMSTSLSRRTICRYFEKSATPAIEHIILQALQLAGDTTADAWFNYIFKDGIHAVDRLANMPTNVMRFEDADRINPLWIIIQLGSIYPRQIRTESNRIVSRMGSKFADLLHQLDNQSIPADAIETLGLALMSTTVTLSTLSKQSTDPHQYFLALTNLNHLLGLAIKSQHLEARF